MIKGHNDALILAYRVGALAGTLDRMTADFAQDSELCKSSRREELGELRSLSGLTYELTKELCSHIDNLSVDKAMPRRVRPDGRAS